MRDTYLLLYDVRDDRRLRQVAKILEGSGRRVQYSVFVCKLSETELERLCWELAKVLQDEDDLLVVELCKRCREKLRQRNPDSWVAEEAREWTIV